MLILNIYTRYSGYFILFIAVQSSSCVIEEIGVFSCFAFVSAMLLHTSEEFGGALCNCHGIPSPSVQRRTTNIDSFTAAQSNIVRSELLQCRAIKRNDRKQSPLLCFICY